MNKSEQFAALDDLGITWYVPKDFCSDDFQTIDELAEASGSIEASEPIMRLAAAVLADDPTTASEPEVIVQEAPASKSEPDVAPEPNITPFNWFIVEIGFAYFVCDIKQPRLSPVWQAAAEELLGDIAIAVGAVGSLSSRYFSWPPTTTPTVLPDSELPFLLSEFLSSEVAQPLYILLGDDASGHVQPEVCKGQARVAGPSLGDLFRDSTHKKALWQQLQPLIRSV